MTRLFHRIVTCANYLTILLYIFRSSNFYAKAEKENAEIILDYDNNNISFKVEDTEFTINHKESP